MPELAEVEYMRHRWAIGIGSRIVAVATHARARVFRGCEVSAFEQLEGARLRDGFRSGKQLMFSFGPAGWLGLHLGMTGELRVEPASFSPGRHDHLVLRQTKRALVFRDPRMFGWVVFQPGPREPDWWRDRPPEIVDPAFDHARLANFLKRRARSPLKAVLLMQETFPGIGNWMADEVLWRAGIHPARLAGGLTAVETARLLEALKFVCRGALRSVVRDSNGNWSDPPRGWLFHQRWSDGGRCPISGKPLVRETIGGRTTCWSPGVQALRSQRSQV